MEYLWYKPAGGQMGIDKGQRESHFSFWQKCLQLSMCPLSGVWIVNTWKYRSITRSLFLGQDTQVSAPVKYSCSSGPHPTLLFAQETAQDLILISLALSNNILWGLDPLVW